jgi:hypothetical protein
MRKQIAPATRSSLTRHRFWCLRSKTRRLMYWTGILGSCREKRFLRSAGGWGGGGLDPCGKAGIMKRTKACSRMPRNGVNAGDLTDCIQYRTLCIGEPLEVLVRWIRIRRVLDNLELDCAWIMQGAFVDKRTRIWIALGLLVERLLALFLIIHDKGVLANLDISTALQHANGGVATETSDGLSVRTTSPCSSHLHTCMTSRPIESHGHASEPLRTRERATREMRLPWRSSALASISLAVGKTIYPVCDGNQEPIRLPHRQTALYPVQCVVSTIDISTVHTPLARAERADWRLARAMASQ